MKNFKIGDYVRGTDEFNSDILKAVVTTEPWEEIEIEWVELKVINSTKPEAIGKTFSICTSYLEEIKPEESAQKENKFKVGDHVKVISEIGTTETNAEVIFVEPDDYDGDLDIRIAGKDCVLWVNSKNFQLVDSGKAIVSSFVINGQEYTNEQFEKDCDRFVREFLNDKTIELNHAIEDVLIVYQWARENPTNLEHYAAEMGWNKEQSDFVYIGVCPVPYPNYKTCQKRTSGGRFTCKECRKWWNQTWKGAECTIQ